MNPVLWALDAHVVALGLLSWFCLCCDAREERERGQAEEGSSET
ncbi:hypothetical protein TURBIDO_64 [Mycobacterium phage Turbido]|uniref:Uncharacterized protein n=5 Tax=Turbidovirus TaxID=2948936 RepID=A0A1D8EZT8_9CAUD|nr:hypothetical protein TURBIDO_64 [Mycobacterium phage Turbido]YP_010063596.1 hypothetical protein KIY81_gp29 [Mycobacterium phage Bugsy]AOT27753.1 hypothetical protein SEA_JERM_65 [Mycobacterium phage Jerm]AWH13581.1 hypothetical protein SEA_ABBYPAIGE_65 [Mycobacterium phage AbbyPaige]AYD86613.1 membrane protein [Mycobacterium phage LilTurb]QZE10964.1 hypothetical protein SEA_AGAPE74_65 [Mycobacterium phage Agape74]AEL17803.1 hypothetical protein TURBIDO_64 [Mycobacterium phage Turbido]